MSDIKRTIVRDYEGIEELKKYFHIGLCIFCTIYILIVGAVL